MKTTYAVCIGTFIVSCITSFVMGLLWNPFPDLEAHRKSAVDSGYAEYRLNPKTGKVEFSWILRPISIESGSIMINLAIQTLKDAIVENAKLDRALLKSQHEEILQYWRNKDNPLPKVPIYFYDSTPTNIITPQWDKLGHLNWDTNNNYWHTTVPPEWIIYPQTNNPYTLGGTICR